MQLSLWMSPMFVVMLQGNASHAAFTALGEVDTARVQRDARRAQSEFESLRRAHLPIEDRGSGPCDVQVGRFCYWADDGEELARTPDPHRIVTGRERLLRRLDSLQRLSPANGWITGQRVRYLIEAGRDTAALEAADGCAAERSWCLALRAYAQHAAGEFVAAETAFDSALAVMPDDERCRWRDVTLLVDDDVEKLLSRRSCDEQTRIVERIWWLGTPLFLTGANDLRTEHFARLVRARIEEHAASPQSTTWGKDVYELMLRYGWPTWYAKTRPSASAMSESSIIGHDPSPSFAFLPRRSAVDSATAAPPAAWRLRARDARSRYAPAYIKRMRPLEHQLAVFRRRDSALVVAAFDVGRDTSFREAPVRAGVFLTWDVDSIAGTGESTGTSGVVTTIAPWRPMLASVEVQSSERKAAARARLGIRMPAANGRVSLSDIMLFKPDGSTPRALRDVLPHALATTRVESRDQLGIFWETYGVREDGEVFDIALTIEEISAPFLRRAARALHLADRGASPRVRWQEIPDRGSRAAARAVNVSLSRLGKGRYRIRLTVTPEGEAPVVATREIEIVR